MDLKIHKLSTCTDPQTCSCENIEKVESIRYLGIIIDQHLKWQEHIQDTTKKLRRTIYKFIELRDILDIHTLRSVYCALVQSVLEYGILTWGGAYNVHADALIKAQKAIIRVMLKKTYTHPSQPLFQELNLMTFQQLYCRSLLLQAFYHKNNEDLLLKHSHNIRLKTSFNFYPVLTSTTAGKRFAKHLSVRLFNRLPNEIKNLKPKPIFYKKNTGNYMAKK